MKLPNFDLGSPKKPCKPATLSRVWHASRRAISLHHSPPHQFALCQWQKSTRPSTYYLVYRWLLFLLVVAIAIASFACQKLPKYYTGPPTKLNYFKWFIYFTNWGFIMIILQSGLALAVVLRYRTERNLPTEYIEEESLYSRPRSPLLCRLYWLFHSVATDLAFVITLIYWTLVHNPELYDVNAMNILVHGFNTFLMLLELCVTSHPLNAAHALYGAGIGFLYGVFSAIYWAAGGTNKSNKDKPIYSALNWDSPGSALGFVAMCACVLCFSHAAATALAALRSRLAKRICKRDKPVDALGPITITQ